MSTLIGLLTFPKISEKFTKISFGIWRWIWIEKIFRPETEKFEAKGKGQFSKVRFVGRLFRACWSYQANIPYLFKKFREKQKKLKAYGRHTSFRFKGFWVSGFGDWVGFRDLRRKIG